MLEVVDEEDKLALEGERCSKCHISRAEDYNLNLFAGLCGHFLCKTCYTSEFDGRPSAECLICGEKRQRNSYVPKRFESGDVHRAIMIRLDMLKDLNLTIEDFDNNERRYNDYLEFREDVVYNLEFNIDTHRTEKRLELFRKRHRDQINKNISRMKRERMARENHLRAKEEEEKLKLMEKAKELEDARAARERVGCETSIKQTNNQLISYLISFTFTVLLLCFFYFIYISLIL
eukprot:m.65834 g.65834  ORF g.65834 m.65834 type:complete len:233 (+) comp11539_c4_seq2:8483-9181(+)